MGNLPPATTADELKFFFSDLLKDVSEFDGVLSAWISPDGKYGFVELSTIRSASTAMAVNGVDFQGFPLKVSRPNNYNATTTTTGPTSLLPYGL